MQCYHDTSQVTGELVQSILLPGLEPGAVDVFLEFICYSGGPLPEELLPQVKVCLQFSHPMLNLHCLNLYNAGLTLLLPLFAVSGFDSVGG